MFKSTIMHKMKIHNTCNGLFPLLMQEFYSKLILVIKAQSDDRFSKFLQVLLQQIEI